MPDILKAILRDIITLMVFSLIAMVALNFVFPDLYITFWRALVFVVLFRILMYWTSD